MTHCYYSETSYNYNTAIDCQDATVGLYTVTDNTIIAPGYFLFSILLYCDRWIGVKLILNFDGDVHSY